MPLFGSKKSPELPAGGGAIATVNDDIQILSNMHRGMEIGDFVAVCRTDYVQSFSDQWIARFDYKWTEYLLLVKDLLQKPGDLSALVYLPMDLSEVYYVIVPPQSPNYTHLTPQGRSDYELYPGYEQQVDEALYKDYASLPKRSVFHSVDPQGAGWDAIVDDVLMGRARNVVVEYNGTKYDYSMPTDPKEAEAAAFTAMATRYGAYPMEESLRADRKFDIVPAVPDGTTAKVMVREFIADPKSKAPFRKLSFQRTEVPPGSVPSGQPAVMNNISFGNDLSENESVINYLFVTYVQLDIKNPIVKIAGHY
jgi:hypothetical protein